MPLIRIARVLALLALAVMAPPSAPQVASPHAIDIPRWFTDSFLDFRDDVADAARDGKRLMLYFGQDGCPYCKLLMQSSFSETRIVDKARRGFVAVALNLWGDREVTWFDGRRMTEKELGRTLGVQFTPTLLFLDEKGDVVLRLNGYQPPHRLDASLDYVAGRLEKKQPYADYMERFAREPAASALTPQPFFIKPPYRLHDRRSSKPLLVVLERTHCASCDELHRDGFARPEVKRLIGAFDVARLDLRDHTALTTPDGKTTTASAWARELGVSYAPALLFFDRAGKEVFRVDGYLRPFHVASALDYVATGAYARESSFQRFLQARADAMRQRGEAVDLWK